MRAGNNEKTLFVFDNVDPDICRLSSPYMQSCDKCDSRIGFGTGGLFDDNNTCGNERIDKKHTKGQGYILVQ